MLIATLFLNRAGRFQLASHVFVGASFVILNVLVFASRGPQSALFSLNASFVALAANLLGNRVAGRYALAAIGVGCGSVDVSQQIRFYGDIA